MSGTCLSPRSEHFRHPVLGDLHLTYTRLDLPADPGLTLFTYTAEPGSRSEETLTLLGSWAAAAESSQATDQSPGEALKQ
jgi:hypothetical protein